jgi:hypothetical protein
MVCLIQFYFAEIGIGYIAQSKPGCQCKEEINKSDADKIQPGFFPE